MKVFILTLFLLGHLFVFGQKNDSYKKELIDIENIIYSGRLDDALTQTKKINNTTNSYVKQRCYLLYAKIAFLKGDLKQMNSYLPRINDKYPDVSYYKKILYGHYLIWNEQTQLGNNSFELAIEQTKETENKRIFFDNLNTKLHLNLNQKSREKNTNSNKSNDQTQKILDQFGENQSQMELFEKSTYYSSQVAFCSKEDTSKQIELGKKLVQFGEDNQYYTSIILGSLVVSEYQDEASEKLMYLKKALNQIDHSQHILLNSRVYFSLMDYYQENNDLDSAIYWCRKSIFPGNIDLSVYLSPYKRLSILFEEKGDLKNALKYKRIDAKKYQEVSQKHSNNIREYLIGGLEKTLKEKNDLLSRNKWLIISISIFAGFLLLLLYYVLKLDSKLRKALVSVRQSNAQIELFSRILSHDLNAPLYSISKLIGYVQENESDLEFKSESYLIAAKEACTNSSLLINNMMTLISHKNKQIDFETSSFSNILNVVKQNLKDQIEINNATILEVDTPSEIWVNEIMFTQLLQNLIQNSIKYRQNELDPIIEIHYKPLKKGFSLTLEDNGKGIPKGKAEVLLKAFEQDVFTSMEKGVGLGLAICRVIVELHSGTIKLANNENEGISVEMTFNPEK